MTQITLRDYLQSIEDALTSEQVDEALSKCQYVQSQFPDALEVQRLLGETYLKQGRMQEAQLAFDWVLTNDPENVVVYCDRALISERLADYETALDCYQQAYELSRGNSGIRQLFNMLSARTGQQGFMLSRAGLARLYMSGDLLSQAAQEWEMVLSVTPERLDARTGLLETYWREGLDERVEQLAHQILRDFPECLKALLLLAHVTAPRDMQQARELIQHAEALDPDLLMARELFGDAIAAQPGHPFWKLVNKAPVVLAQALPQNEVEQRVQVQDEHILAPVMREQVLVPDSLLQTSSPTPSRESSLDVSENWSNLSEWQGLQELQGWQSIDALTPAPEQASLSSSSHDINDVYASLMGREENTQDAVVQEPIEDRPTMEFPLHQSEQSHDMPPLDAMDAEWLMANDEQDAASSISPEQGEMWAFSMQPPSEAQNEMSSPPAWLSMLTQDEQQTQNEFQQSLNQAPAFDDEEESFFGPAWLKSLGAASLDEEPQEEQNLLTTLEGLEQDLREQGFVPLEPNTLSTIAQSEQELEEVSLAPESVSNQNEAQEILSSSSNESEPTYQEALLWAAELPSVPSPSSTVSTTVKDDESVSKIENAAMGDEDEVDQERPVELPSQLSYPMPVEQKLREPEKQEEQIAASVNEGFTQETVLPIPFGGSEPAFALNPLPVSVPQSEPLKPAASLHDMFSDDLEVTMKRPAIHLQPVQQARKPQSTSVPPAPSAFAASAPQKERVERRELQGTSRNDGGMSNQERLRRGYQHQLVGDYDEAMQEYRILIRNAPELLSEVVSNVRTLLQLAPKYSAGYRVLGDAYMRQGEYLQAMDAYNQALAITKKARV